MPEMRAREMQSAMYATDAVIQITPKSFGENNKFDFFIKKLNELPLFRSFRRLKMREYARTQEKFSSFYILTNFLSRFSVVVAMSNVNLNNERIENVNEFREFQSESERKTENITEEITNCTNAEQTALDVCNH